MFFDVALAAGGQPNPDFIPEHAGLAERDIPAGYPLPADLSREHAVWGLKQLGSAGADR